MPNKRLPKDHVEALEKILGVKLPEEGFKVEIKKIEAGELDDGELDKVTGGVNFASSPRDRDFVAVHVSGDVGILNAIHGFIAKI